MATDISYPWFLVGDNAMGYQHTSASILALSVTIQGQSNSMAGHTYHYSPYILFITTILSLLLASYAALHHSIPHKICKWFILCRFCSDQIILFGRSMGLIYIIHSTFAAWPTLGQTCNYSNASGVTLMILWAVRFFSLTSRYLWKFGMISTNNCVHRETMPLICMTIH